MCWYEFLGIYLFGVCKLLEFVGLYLLSDLESFQLLFVCLFVFPHTTFFLLLFWGSNSMTVKYFSIVLQVSEFVFTCFYFW